MAISAQLREKITRYHYVEKWPVGTIARQLHVHHSTVKRVLANTGVPVPEVLRYGSMIEPYLPFIFDMFAKYSNLRASRLYAMVRERGYPGGEDHFRHLIAIYRPKPIAEAYLRLRTLPGEQAQVDWGHFGHITIGQAKRTLNAFVMVLSYSRKVFVYFYLNQQLMNFLRGHHQAFEVFGGVPRVLLYDNLKSAVLERMGDAIRFHPTLLDFAGHYRFEPRPVAVARGNEKGRVERAIRYIRDNFFAARQYRDLDDLNQQALTWANGQASNRPCPEDKTQTVSAMFSKEQSHLLALPDNPFSLDEQCIVKVGKTPYVRFDLNDYSVPHTCVRRSLTVRASLKTVSIVDADTCIAKHPRSFDKGQQIEDPAHIEALIQRKKHARVHRAQHRLIQAIPVAEQFLCQAAERGQHLATLLRELNCLLDTYGTTELQQAINDAIARDVPHTNAVRLALQRQREQRDQPPPMPVPLPDDKRLTEQVIRVHPLTSYDHLQKNSSTKHEDTKND